MSKYSNFSYQSINHSLIFGCFFFESPTVKYCIAGKNIGDEGAKAVADALKLTKTFQIVHLGGVAVLTPSFSPPVCQGFSAGVFGQFPI